MNMMTSQQKSEDLASSKLNLARRQLAKASCLWSTSMDRREFNSVYLSLLGAALALAQTPTLALSVAELSNTEAARGLKAALEQGAHAAIGQLGKTDGFLGNEKVRIPLPKSLADASQFMRTFGMGAHLDELLVAMNRAAETAVPLARDMLVDAVRGMNLDDAKKILNGGNTAASSFFEEKTRLPLGLKFLPVVTGVTEKIGLAENYNHVAGKAADLGLMRREDASIQQFVTTKALDGLYLMIAEEEEEIRRDPIATGSALLSKVFGALK
jgi:hypothetical protein